MKQPPTILMVQVMPSMWQIVSQKGHIIQKSIIASSVSEATEYVAKYASSFNDWTFEVVLLKDNKRSKG